jgi:uncharacterized protein
MTMRVVDVAWVALQWPGCEHVIASIGPGGFTADSSMVLASEAGPARVNYRLTCDSSWQVTTLTATVTDATSARSLALTRDAAGHWMANGNRPLPDLHGCVDIDINRSPLTNILPIRRLGAVAAGTPNDIDVAYVSVPELTVLPARQRYTLLHAAEPVYRYESGSFSADLPIDDDGFVIDYPGVWRRIGHDHAGAEDREASS